MDAIAGPAPVPDALAREHLVHHSVREGFIRRPWMVRDIPVEGVEHLQRACATGRGVLVSYCHLGPFPGLGVTASEHVGNVHQVALAWLANPQPDPTQRVRWQAWRSMFTASGVPLIAAKGCFPVVQELLGRGAVVVMAFDWPGSAETIFLGRPVALASGTAKLSHLTGALVVPAMRHLTRWRPRTVFGPPIDPALHEGWRQVHEAVARRHEAWIRACPAALEDPRRTAAWESAATAERWADPRSGVAAGSEPGGHPPATVSATDPAAGPTGLGTGREAP